MTMQAIADWIAESLPSRERGLKFSAQATSCLISSVAPLAGAWIEIVCRAKENMMIFVAPLAGAWIEIRLLSPSTAKNSRRSPRGSVD